MERVEPGQEKTLKKFRVRITKMLLNIVHLVVKVYTFVTLPIYYLLQDPVGVRKASRSKRAEQIDPSDPYSPWKATNKRNKKCILDHVEDIEEMISNLGGYYNLDRPAIGYRRVLKEEVVMNDDGRTPKKIDGREIKKLQLSDYIWLSYREMIARRRAIARGLLVLGVKRHNKIVILCDTSVEFLLMELAILHAGASQVNVFPTLGNDGIAHAIRETEASVIFTSYDLLNKTRTIIETFELKNMKVIYSHRRCETPPSEAEVTEARRLVTPFEKVTFHTLDEIEEMGKKRGNEVECRSKDKDEIAFILYTSGTTGVPKGVQATSGQFIQALRAALVSFEHIIGSKEGEQMFAAFLPQAHIFEATFELMTISLGVPIGFAQPHTLTDSGLGLMEGVASDLRLLRPTFMIAVPLVLERLRKNILAKLEAQSEVSLALFNYMMGYKLDWIARGYKTPIVNRFLCSKIRDIFGGRLEMIIFGSAPISSSLHAFIKAALEIKLLQGYGTTETLGGCICMDCDDLSYGRSGAPFPGNYVRLDDYEEGGYRVTDHPNPRGEMIIGSRGITLNYLERDELNAEVYQADPKLKDVRWFRTGDIVEVWQNGTINIVDRKKDLIKLANGEYISLGKIESILKNNAGVENICVFGNALANFLVALVVPNKTRLEDLQRQATNDAHLKSLFLQSLNETGIANGLAKAERPTKVALVCDEWTPDNGLLTAALKLKRPAIKAHYGALLDRLFGV